MKVLGGEGEDLVVLMMDLMHLIQSLEVVEGAMPPIEEEIVKKIDDNDLSEYLSESREVYKSLLHSYNARHAHEQRVNEQLVYCQVVA